MKCPECLGTAFTEGDYEVAQVINQQPVLIRNVPASKCNQCGYLVIDASVARKIDAALRARRPDAVVPTEVYDLAGPVQASPATAQTRPVKPMYSGTTLANV